MDSRQEEGSCLPLSFADTHFRSLYRSAIDQTSDQTEQASEEALEDVQQQQEEGQASEEPEEEEALEQVEGLASELEEEEEAPAEQAESDYHRREEDEDRLAHRSIVLRPTGTQIRADLLHHGEQAISTCYAAECDA